MRKEKTFHLFADALLELSKKKTMDKITVKEIADQCGLSSQTFKTITNGSNHNADYTVSDCHNYFGFLHGYSGV